MLAKEFSASAPWLRCFGGLVMTAAGMAWTLPAVASSTACRNDLTNKICAEIQVLPADRLQPAGQGGTPTYAYYKIQLKNLSRRSTRYVSLSQALTPAVTVTEFTTDYGSCSSSAGQVNCLFDKLDAEQVVNLTAQVLVPPYTSPSQPDYLLTNLTTFGWQGNTAQIDANVLVSTGGGSSYIPANQEVTLTTAPRATDPAQQVDADSPLFAQVTIPPNAGGYVASLAIVNEPRSANPCVAGVYYSTGSDGGPYICRDPGQPNRRVALALKGGDTASNQPQFDPPLQILATWDASIMPALQLDPVPPLFPTGTPPFAMFFQGYLNDSTPDTDDDKQTGEVRAISGSCAEGQPPCLSTVKKFSSGDWTATLLKRNAQGVRLSAGGSGEDSGAGSLQIPALGGVSIQGIVDPPNNLLIF